jgi:signal transduction histidine kinase
MKNNQTSRRIYQGVYYLAAGLLYFAVLLRSILLYQGTSFLWQVLGLLLLFLFFLIVESVFSERMGKWMHLYIALQTLLTCILIYGPDFKEYDYFALLFAILGMQVMQSFYFVKGTIWLVAFLILMAYPFLRIQGILLGIINTLLFGSVMTFISFYSLATRRARAAHQHNQLLMNQLKQANRQLETYSDTLRQLGVANERQRLRRELHDSVTQTIFSMTLTTQSALLLTKRDPTRVGDQLERLNQLTQSALAEMHTLISELRPDQQEQPRLAAKLRQHIDQRQLPEGLTVTIEVEGDQKLSPEEEAGLFRIVQEALNNVVKHAQASRATLHLHLIDPCWTEVEDNGLGFDVQQTQGRGKFGLAGMRERAEEIDWELVIKSETGKGSQVRVQKKYPAETRQ